MAMYNSYTQVIKEVSKELGIKVIAHTYEGEYQTTHCYLLSNGDKYALLWVYQGTCALCDAFQSYSEQYWNAQERGENTDNIWKPFVDGYRYEIKALDFRTCSEILRNTSMDFAASEYTIMEVILEALVKDNNGRNL
jgi:hypothetical protein